MCTTFIRTFLCFHKHDTDTQYHFHKAIDIHSGLRSRLCNSREGEKADGATGAKWFANAAVSTEVGAMSNATLLSLLKYAGFQYGKVSLRAAGALSLVSWPCPLAVLQTVNMAKSSLRVLPTFRLIQITEFQLSYQKFMNISRIAMLQFLFSRAETHDCLAWGCLVVLARR